jgi:putative membrane protein
MTDYTGTENKMIKEEPADNEQKQIVVLCVDRDGDIGAKADVKTPVIGRKENLDAAVRLALSDPEEPDANAMFEALRIYDLLKKEATPKETFEIATISGSELGGVGADRKIVAELGELLSSFPATEVILVVDGYSDEAVLPLVQSRVPVSSVSRIVVKHSESIEETAAIFSRYLKMIVENPRYSRFMLGVPGILVLVAGVLWIFNLLSIFWIVFIFVLSAIMVIKGFGADRAAKNFYEWIKEYSPPPLRVQISSFSLVAGTLCIMLAAYLGWNTAATFVAANKTPTDLEGWLSIFPQITGHFIKDSMTLIVVGICVALLGRAIRWYLEHDTRLLRNAALIASIGWSRQILDATSDLLITPGSGYEKLIFTIIVGILIGVASVLVIFVVHRSSREFFGETEEQVEEFGES